MVKVQTVGSLEELFDVICREMHDQKKADQNEKADVICDAATESAKVSKEIYDAYIAQGFREDQAFELLKLVVSR